MIWTGRVIGRVRLGEGEGEAGRRMGRARASEVRLQRTGRKGASRRALRAVVRWANDEDGTQGWCFGANTEGLPPPKGAPRRKDSWGLGWGILATPAIQGCKARGRREKSRGKAAREAGGP